MNTLVALPAAAALLAGAFLVPTADATDVGLIAPAGVVRAEGQGFSYDLGTKHAVGYFAKNGDACALTLVVAERVDSETNLASPGARISVSVAGGSHAMLETGEGPALQVRCAADAASVTVTPIGGGGAI